MTLSNQLLKLLPFQKIQWDIGTASRVVRTRYNCSDWAVMYRFTQENDAAHVLEKRINIKAMEEFLTEHPDSLPVGLHSDKAYTVQVRKPTTKVK